MDFFRGMRCRWVATKKKGEPRGDLLSAQQHRAGQAACLTVVLLPRRDRDRDDPLLFSVIRVDRRPSSSSSCGGGWPLSLASASLRHKTKTALLVGFLASRDSHPEAAGWILLQSGEAVLIPIAC